MIAYTLRYGEELRDAAPFFAEIKSVKIDSDQLALAKELIRRKTGKFDPSQFKDDYEAALHAVIDAKIKHTPLPKEDSEPKRGKVVNLMDALRRSLDQKDSKSVAAVTPDRKTLKKAVASSRARAGGKGPILITAPARPRKSAWVTDNMAPRKTNAKSATKAVEEQLARYRSMRDFATTSESRGGGTRDGGVRDLPFVVQKHAATRLHHDFRLGWRRVLKSWAVTKGPSFFPGDNRLAVQVEDHPMEYGGFEGLIPRGQCGRGTVMIWDQGTWEPHGDVDEGLKKGSLKFTLHGTKLKGKWALIRMGVRAAQEKMPTGSLGSGRNLCRSNYERKSYSDRKFRCH